ncbi:TetR/AcrR family transcriptional regulator [Streptomyces sp. B-S-A8]|uniref:TetR/AcrR family transcriptional regulator n=1 Tax=Streptomyces solicavernae TaxID=3043614 RepID=A0ABT6RYL8_9ACTN|nr:TetR/AcrR family transcriptional regulator [Streptomyces sp. B-S-A8]MDI3389537.1 TetR/AcrR family transcriptional regulator [Streptomyces sp. B-S-A8]
MKTEQFGVDAGAHDAARTIILDAAADVFQRQGFTRTTVDDIADAIDATKGRVYYYFRSKFDIFLAVYEHGMRKVREAVEPLAESPGTGRDRLRAMAVAHIENLMVYPGYHNTIHQGVHGQATTALKPRQLERLAELNRTREDYELMFRHVVTEGMADGTLRAEDPKLAARVLLSCLNATDMWFQPRPGQTTAELHDLAVRIADLVIGGLDQ